jgi:hypothetical protein
VRVVPSNNTLNTPTRVNPSILQPEKGTLLSSGSSYTYILPRYPSDINNDPQYPPVPSNTLRNPHIHGRQQLRHRKAYSLQLRPSHSLVSDSLSQPSAHPHNSRLAILNPNLPVSPRNSSPVIFSRLISRHSTDTPCASGVTNTGVSVTALVRAQVG